MWNQKTSNKICSDKTIVRVSYEPRGAILRLLSIGAAAAPCEAFEHKTEKTS